MTYQESKVWIDKKKLERLERKAKRHDELLSKISVWAEDIKEYRTIHQVDDTAIFRRIEEKIRAEIEENLLI